MTNEIEQNRSQREFSWLERLNRTIRYRLHIPMKRSRHSVRHIARGVMVGVVWAMTPIIGLQMLSVFATWLISRKLFNWDFSLVNGLAWTWTTNVFTAIPIFYIFYLTGRIMLGQADDITGYDNFKAAFELAEEAGTGFWDSARQWFAGLAVGIGWPMTVGCIPWAILSGWLSYRMSYRFVERYRAMRAKRMKRAAKQASASPPPPERA